MKLFRSKRVKDTAGTDVLAGKIACRILRQQVKVAGWLNGKTVHFSSGKWLRLLILFCLFTGSICLYLIISSI